MGKEVKRTFVFNIDWRDVLMDYPAEVRYEVYDAIIEYAASGKLNELKPLAKMAFSFIKKEMDYNSLKYDTMVGKRSEAGRKGMASRYGERRDAEGLTNVTSGNKTNNGYQPLTNVTSGNKTNYNDNDNDIKKKSSTDVEDEKETPSPSPPTLEGEIEALKGDMCWLDQLQVLHRMGLTELQAKLDEFRLHCAADGMQRHEDLYDAKRHFNNWLRITATKQTGYGNSEKGYTSKREANDYAMRQYIADREALGQGIGVEAEKPF